MEDILTQEQKDAINALTDACAKALAKNGKIMDGSSTARLESQLIEAIVKANRSGLTALAKKG